MKVREIMTSDVGYCRPDATLTNAAMIMWQRDCGVVPIVDEEKRVVGMITDRDICIAVATKNRLASEIRVGELAFGNVRTCRPNDELETILKTMKKRQLRRLPVTNSDEVLIGIISIGDLLNAGKGKDFKRKLFRTLREISSFRPLYLHELPDETETSKRSKTTLSDQDKDFNDNSETSITAETNKADELTITDGQEIEIANAGSESADETAANA